MSPITQLVGFRLRQVIGAYADGAFDGAPADFHRDCLDELKRLRKSGRLSTPEGAHAAVARQAAGFTRHADPQGLVEETRRPSTASLTRSPRTTRT
jgi:hypothetical protein